MDLIKIGKYIAGKRKSLGMTQKQLAEKLGMSDKSVSKWERGVWLPDVSVYKELCSILGISLNEFLAGEDIAQENMIQKSETNIIEVIRYNIDTNRVNIPFSILFEDGRDLAEVKFYTYGDMQSEYTVVLDRTKLMFLYKKDLNNILLKFKTDPPGNKSDWAYPSVTSTVEEYHSPSSLGYGDAKYGGVTEETVPRKSGYGGILDINNIEHGTSYMLYKLSTTGNVTINDQKIINIFDTVYFDTDANLAITSQTISHIKGKD